MGKMDFAAMRAAMVVSQLRTSDVSDPAIVAAMASVAREKFVPAEKAASAYIDRALALGGGRALNPPLATGRLLNIAAVRAGDKVLLIGAATGYTAAVLAALGAQVVAVEENAALVPAGAIAGVTWVNGPLSAGAPAQAPFDVLLVDGAIEALPSSLTDQLAEGGRIATGLIERGVTRIEAGRKVAGTIGLSSHFDMELAVLPGFSQPAGFTF